MSGSSQLFLQRLPKALSHSNFFLQVASPWLPLVVQRIYDTQQEVLFQVLLLEPLNTDKEDYQGVCGL